MNRGKELYFVLIALAALFVASLFLSATGQCNDKGGKIDGLVCVVEYLPESNGSLRKVRK